jgi:16S rRNA (guanine527-N7)-methyltransferase
LSRPLEPRHAALLERYVAELQRWGDRINLVGSTQRDAIQVHLDDALPAAWSLPHDARVVDLGSGAGLPGIPLAIVRPDLDLTLVEIRERRVSFLRHVVRQLELCCEIRRVQIEEPPSERYDFALARALAEPPEALRLALPWVRNSGEVWLWSRAQPEELGIDGVSAIPLGSRGRILRVPVASAAPTGR